MRRHYLQSLSPPANPFIHRSFPGGKNDGGGNGRGAYPRGDTALSVVADTGRMSAAAKRGSEPGGKGPGRTCRSGSSKGRIIRADRIVLLVIQIRLSYPALRRPGISRELRRQGERTLSFSERSPTPDRSSSRPFESALDPSREARPARSTNCSSSPRNFRSLPRNDTLCFP